MLAGIAARLLDIAVPGLDRLGLPPAVAQAVHRILHRRLCEGISPAAETHSPAPAVEGIG